MYELPDPTWITDLKLLSKVTFPGSTATLIWMSQMFTEIRKKTKPKSNTLFYLVIQQRLQHGTCWSTCSESISLVGAHWVKAINCSLPWQKKQYVITIQKDKQFPQNQLSGQAVSGTLQTPANLYQTPLSMFRWCFLQQTHYSCSLVRYPRLFSLFKPQPCSNRCFLQYLPQKKCWCRITKAEKCARV